MADNIVFRAPAAGDAARLAARLRAIDKAEIAAISGRDPVAAIQAGIEESSFCLGCEIDGVLVTLFGAIPETLLGRRAIVWMLCAEGIERHGAQFLRRSKRFVADLSSVYPHLWNWVHDANTISIRWLRWCGFTVDPVTATGLNGEPLRKFHLERGHV